MRTWTFYSLVVFIFRIGSAVVQMLNVCLPGHLQLHKILVKIS